ncbi:MAG TPA: RHS repeat-associated core domain-containing protein [Thermoanaerobaculia bacterium]
MTSISDALKNVIKLEQLPPSTSSASPVDLLKHATLSLDSTGRRVTLLLGAPLARGADFELTLSKNLRDRSDNNLGLGQLGEKTDSGVTPIDEPHDIRMHFTTRAPAGELSRFTLRQREGAEFGAIRELTTYQNLLFVTALDGGILAYDMSDPAALSDGASTPPKAMSMAPGRDKPTDDPVTEYWTLQVDHHGRIFSAGTTNLYGLLRTFRVEDFIKAKDKTTADCAPTTMKNTVCEHVGSGIVSQVPGTAYVAGLATSMVAGDRVEATPRKLKIVVGDAAPAKITRSELLDAPYAVGSPTDVGNGLRKFDVRIPAVDAKYRLQRITLENVTLGLRWSADAKASDGGELLDEAVLHDVVAGPNDELRIIRNLSTHAVITLFGFGIGVFDVNAIESNDSPFQIEDIKPEKMPREQVALRGKAFDDPALANPASIDSLAFSPESEIVPVADGSLRVYTVDHRKGVVEFTFMPPGAPRRAGEVLFDSDNLRYNELHAQVGTSLRLNSIAAYTNASNKTYLLVPALQHGLFVIAAGADPLDVTSFADVIWSPAGAYAVRVVPGSDMAVIINRDGYAQLVDLTRIDQRMNGDVATVGLFPSAQEAIAANAPDPRIIWTSEDPVATGTGFIPPVIDGETGIMITADLLKRDMQVHSAIDPRFRVMADIGDTARLRELGSIVPLGIEPPKDVLRCTDAATNDTCHGSLAAFRVEATLPGAMAESLGGELRIAIESERVPGVTTGQTAAPFPVSHLRVADLNGDPDDRATTVTMKRVLPEIPELRYQKGYNRLVSPWIIAVADPRAAKQYTWPTSATPADKEAAGCHTCARPKYLQSDTTALELYTTGRFIGIRADTELTGTYSFLAEDRRMATRVSTTPADTVRPKKVQIAPQAPPVADGALQETTYVHSGEVQASAIDLNAGGRSGLDVLADRTYLSRTLGGTAFGTGWDSALFRRLRALPNGNVEYRDGSGETWLFTRNGSTYDAQKGVFLKLTQTANGWTLIDQQRRQIRFDLFGRLIAETDHLYDLAGNGNMIEYLYDASGRVSHVIDPVGRATTITYNDDGLVSEIVDWRTRHVNYTYEQQRLEQVQLPRADAAEGVPSEYAHAGSDRPRIVYVYDTDGGSSFNDLLELKTNLKSITDPAEATSTSGTARVTFEYTDDKVRQQTWATGEKATFVYTDTTTTVVDALGQERVYTLTGADEYDKRQHIASVVMTGVPTLEFPATISVAADPDTEPVPQSLDATMTYTEHGQLHVLTNPNELTTEFTYDDAPGGAPGKVLTISKSSGPGYPGGITRFDHDPSSAMVKNVKRSEAGSPELERATPHPTRNQKRVVVTDDGIDTVSVYEKDGQLRKTMQMPAGDETPKIEAETIYYEPVGVELSRSRPFLVTRGGGLEKHNFAYTLMADGGEKVEQNDMVRGTKTVTTLDSYGRTVRQVVTDATDEVLSDERFGYDASGRLAYHQRAQKGLGPVITRIRYDALGRALETSVTKAEVEGAPVTVTATTVYDPANLTITRRDPTSGGGTAPAQEITHLDKLGRTTSVERSAGSKTVVQRYAYGKSGQVSFETDGVRLATSYHHDLLGRVTAAAAADGMKVETKYSPWGEPELVTTRDAAGAIVGQTKNFFTDRGQLRSTNEALGTGARKTEISRLDGGSRTVVRVGAVTSFDAATLGTGLNRAQQSVVDSAGRVTEERIGEAAVAFPPGSNAGTWSRTTRSYVGSLPTSITTYEPKAGDASYTTTIDYDGLERPTLQTDANAYSVSTTYDEAGNPLTVTRPGMNAEVAKYDSRGLVTRRDLPDGTKQQFKYDAIGNLRERIDEAGESTYYDYDALGRLEKIRYADDTSEETLYENQTGSVLATRNRAGQWLSYSYDKGGRVLAVHDGTNPIEDPSLIEYKYDDAGRLTLVKNADAGIEYAQHDQFGRPGVTRTYRYMGSTGLYPTPAILDVHVQKHEWSIHDGERTSWRMPAAGATPPIADSLSKWLQTIEETRDAGSNLTLQERNDGGALNSSDARSIGRLLNRRRTLLSGANLTTAYGFADGQPVPAGIDLPPLTVGQVVAPSGLPVWNASSIGDVRLGGTTTVRDRARRIASLRDLGTQRVSRWGYDNRGRVDQTWLAATSTLGTVPAIDDTFINSDFRSARAVTPLLSPAQHEKLEADAAKIEPLTWTATRLSADRINTRTPALDGAAQAPLQYVFEGGRRTSDGVWTYSFDAFGRVTSAVSAQRKIDFTWDPNDRLVGRAAHRVDASGAWVVENDNDVLNRDGLPAKTTFVWDPIVDRLVAVYAEGASTESGATTESGLLRQYLHGDQGYDDPTRVLVAGPGGVPLTFLPLMDESGTGSLTAVVDQDGNLVERVLYADSYGDAPRYLTGAVTDKITVEVIKDADGNIHTVDVRLRLSERITASSLGAGARLASVKADNTLAQLSTVTPTIEQDQTIRWSLSATQWAALTGASGAATLEVSLTSALRAQGWGATPVAPLPAWARKLYSGAASTTTQPVIYREPLSALKTFADAIGASTSSTRTLYELPSLYLAASEESRSKLLTGFKAAPLVEPATGLVYFRARWFDPRTGTFLSPDEMGHLDSSNLYAFGAGDPVNNSDPSGQCIFGWGGTCAEWANSGQRKLTGAKQWVDQRTDAGLVGIAINATVGTALDSVDTFILDPLRVGDATGTAIGSDAGGGEIALSVVQDVGRAAAVAAGAGTVIKAGARAVTATSRAVQAGRTAYRSSVLSSQLGSVGAGVVNVSAAQSAARARVLANLAKSRAARQASHFDDYARFDNLYDLAGKVDVATDPGQAVFYSGRFPLNRNMATNFAETTGRRTIEMTPGGGYFDALDLYGRGKWASSTRADAIWIRLSERFAGGASGKVNAFTFGASPLGVFNTVEFPILRTSGRIRSITYRGFAP